MVTIFIYNICVLNNILEVDRLYREFRGGILKVSGICKNSLRGAQVMYVMV